MKTAVVTGAAQGVGLVTASHLARLGYRVILTDIQSLESHLNWSIGTSAPLMSL